MNNFFEKNLHFIVMIFGIVLLVVGFISIYNQNQYVETKGVITSIDSQYNYANETDEHTVYVEYRANGTLYNEQLGEYDITMRVGQEISVLYNPKSPNKIVKKGYTASIIELTLSVACLSFGIMTWKKKKIQKTSEENGVKI